MFFRHWPCLAIIVSCCLLVGPTVSAQDWPIVESVDRQPLLAAMGRVVTALDSVGSPLSPEQLRAFEELTRSDDGTDVAAAVQALFDPLCLVAVHINAESRVKVLEGPVRKSARQNGWQTFLVKVHNEAGINPVLTCTSPQAKPQFVPSDASAEPAETITMADVQDRWLDTALPVRQPMKGTLSGLALEYRLIQIYSRDSGPREATLAFDIGQGTQDLGFRNEVAILFDCLPAYQVMIDIRDPVARNPGEQMMVALEIRDDQNRVYPNPARRLAPDFFFHHQIYRKRGEQLPLSPGEYSVKISRGPEYLPVQRQLVVTNSDTVLEGQLKRWIDPTHWYWYSGDHHVHAAGCSHYQNPTAGVGPEDMMRHVLGEDLKVGCVLSWGPCWYNQKQFFEGGTSPLSTSQHLMRYDVEVSGFPSSHAGHLCLLRLSEDDYPGTSKIEQWPSWTLPVLQWGQRQQGVVGYSHSGWGLALPDYLADGSRVPPAYGRDGQLGRRAADQLPDYEMPPFDGIGANEFIVTVAHDACDFISTVDTPSIWELNIWYHTLNCGFRSRISGETDFPCIYGDRVGLGRVYVQLDPDQPLEFDAWVNGLKNGRSYCGDGMSHVLKFDATAILEDGSSGETVRMGWPGSNGEISQLNLTQPGPVQLATTIAARLDPRPSPGGLAIRERRLDEKPYWHIERCRIGDSRKVLAELVVNGQAVQFREIEADGTPQQIDWTVDLKRSSWVAVRILPSVHTNPIFVQIGDQPIRASRKSAQWCRRAVDVCWTSKSSQIRESERPDARKAYDRAAEIYEEIIRQSDVD